jgi:hypothetical protein
VVAPALTVTATALARTPLGALGAAVGVVDGWHGADGVGDGDGNGEGDGDGDGVGEVADALCPPQAGRARVKLRITRMRRPFTGSLR